MARRRRDNLPSWIFCLVLVAWSVFPLSFDSWLSGWCSGHKYSSLPAPSQSLHSSASQLFEPRHGTVGSDLSLDLVEFRRNQRPSSRCLIYHSPLCSIIPPVPMVGEALTDFPPVDSFSGEIASRMAPVFFPRTVSSVTPVSKPRNVHVYLLFQSSPLIQAWSTTRRTSFVTAAPRLVKAATAPVKTLSGAEDLRDGLHQQALGPLNNFWRPKSFRDGQIRDTLWPRSVTPFPMSILFTMRNRNCILKGRGHLSSFRSILSWWIDDYKLRTLANPSSSRERIVREIIRLRYLIPRLNTYSFKERLKLTLSSLWERSIPPSSLLGERSFPPLSLLLRGQVLSSSSVSKPGIRFTPQSVLLSCVAVFTGPEDATSFISMRLGGRGFLPTSQLKVTIWLAYDYVRNARLFSVDEFELKIVDSTVMLVFGALHISPDDLSSFVKLVSLSVSFNFYCLMYEFGSVRLNSSCVTR